MVREERGTTSNSADPLLATPRRILDAAVDLFYLQGFRGTTIRNIVDRCGLTPGSVYVHYASKDALLEQIVARTNDELQARLTYAKATAGSRPYEQLAAFVGAFAEFVSENRKISLVADTEWRHLQGTELDKVRGIRRALGEEFSKLIARGVRAGDFALPDGVYGRDGSWLIAVAIISQITRIAAARPQPVRRGRRLSVADTYVELALRQVGASTSSAPPVRSWKGKT